MNIKALTLSNYSDYTDMIEHLSYGHQPNWKGCYCYFYHNNLPFEDWIKRTGEENKVASKQAVIDGTLKGFLAYKDNKVIGWINVNDAIHFHRLKTHLTPVIKDRKVALSICFIVHPDYRNQGVATTLLKHAIDVYKEKGYDTMLALPITSDRAIELNYRGTKGMYEKQGYIEKQVFPMETPNESLFVLEKSLK